MEAMKQPETDKAIAAFKQEIAKLKPKLPKIHQRLEDQAQVLEVIRELREKKTMKEKVLTEQAQRANEMQQIVTKLEQDKKEIDDHAAAQNKCTRMRQKRDTNCRLRQSRNLED